MFTLFWIECSYGILNAASSCFSRIRIGHKANSYIPFKRWTIISLYIIYFWIVLIPYPPGTYFLITYRLCKTFLHRLISLIFCNFRRSMILTTKFKDFFTFTFFVFNCYVRRMERLMVPRVKDNNPFVTQKTVLLDFDEDRSRKDCQENFKTDHISSHNHVIRVANLISLTLWTLTSINLCLWFYLQSISTTAIFSNFFRISTDSWRSFVKIIAHQNAIYSVNN